ncbi:MAG: ATP-grasp domain-containing protein [Mesorhizobium sp.]|uniref:D-alanine--D-alanine ligase family protein n=1 Tax=Mesorhizobium sp. TaxID=1871066 RepID=UPI000FE62031|nr:ATP-grasp domain-containing protein [Mesorhizobium sp.]RWO94838.1 MAG: ATP-grasp domain-containing protein [Mesorhizobium sp.]TIM52307.1 MAG: ATP-grasp domain-containing protein [Mesorhizobium sp.]
MRVAVVWNHDRAGVINRFGQPDPEGGPCRETIESMVAALQEGGHETLLCEGDKGLLTTLERFMPPDPKARPSGFAFNMAYGIQGECRVTHVPAMLEMAGVPYTGSSPLGHGLDKATAKRLLRDAGVPTPNFCVMRSGTDSSGHLRFPLVVKPLHESMSLGLQLVHEAAQLKQAVEWIVTQYDQDALVEEYIDGREIYVALLGNEELEVLPLVEQDFGNREPRLMTWEAKNMATMALQRICPADIGSSLATALGHISVATFHACHCRDFARIDFRIDRSGRPFVLEINSMPGLDPTTAYVLAASTAGHGFSSLVNRILDVAHTRYFGHGAPKAGDACSPRPT